MLTKPTGGSKVGGEPEDRPSDADEAEEPVTRSFLEAFFTSLRDDLQSVKRVFSADLQRRLYQLQSLREACEVLGITEAERETIPTKPCPWGSTRHQHKQKAKKSLAGLRPDPAVMALERKAVLATLTGDTEHEVPP
ncbi:hypothetical protein NDU88_001696 [Pleurodeles waltl]|uniref:Uncharacterized protein n=1 Tax=Pleurodeles waltl TaxID=8319 RepID=A0AAV7NBJ6_PLEWA|nr:hypothetical protein NDU88_001696 [Pleurodeles waltl]